MVEIEIIVTQLIWDNWNTGHIARHGLDPQAVEEALGDPEAVYLKAKQGRVMVLGQSGKRLIATVLNAQETAGAYYVITARDMSKKERALYRSRKEGSHE